MKAVSGKRLCTLLESKGWQLKRINGSHHIRVNGDTHIGRGSAFLALIRPTWPLQMHDSRR